MHTILLTDEEHVKSTFTLTDDHVSDLTFTSLIYRFFLFFDFLCGFLVIQALLQVSNRLLSHEISNSIFRFKKIITQNAKKNWPFFLMGSFWISV